MKVSPLQQAQTFHLIAIVEGRIDEALSIEDTEVQKQLWQN